MLNSSANASKEGDEGGILEAADTDARQRMIASRDYFRRTLGEMSAVDRDRLLPFAVQRCYLVVVEASDQSSAYRIFSVMNDRGLDLTATDILKSDIIGAIDTEDEQEAYNAKSEALEDGLGREAFGDLFAHLRMIHRKQKMRGSLEREFRDYVNLSKSRESSSTRSCAPARKHSSAFWSRTPHKRSGIACLRACINWINQDWQPPAIKFMVEHHANDEAIVQFLKRLDRLAYFLFASRANVNDRLTRYAAVLTDMEEGTALQDGKALDLTGTEKLDFKLTLNGNIYLNQRTPILLRLDEMLSDGTAHYDHALVTIEHILPQNPAADSEWLAHFPTQEIRNEWVHRLANLLLSRYKNPAASNYVSRTRRTPISRKAAIAPTC